MKNILTFDFEDWFQVFYGESYVSKESWEQRPSDFQRMVFETTELLDFHKVKATFFVVGWLATKYPHLVRMLYENGHEIASHGYFHSEVNKMNRDQFYHDAHQSKSELEAAIGDNVIGYRAPGFSILPSNDYALEVLVELGYQYDSSLLYIDGNIAQLGNGLVELPPNSISLFNRFLPVNGGFVFRAMPWFLYKNYIKYLNSNKRSLNFYTHSWELVDSGNRLPIQGVRKFVQYYNIDTVKIKLAKMLQTFDFLPIAQYLKLSNEK